MNQRKLLNLSLAMAIVPMLAGPSALATDAVNIETNNPGYAGGNATYDNAYNGNYPVINAIVSAPGSVDGYTYNGWTFLAQDGSGSLVISYPTSASSYVPTLGDGVSVSGHYSDINSASQPAVPEISASSTISITQHTTGNPVPAPRIVSNLLAIDASRNGRQIPEYYYGYYLQLDNVTINQFGGGVIAPGTLFPTHANAAYTITDSSDSLPMSFYASFYSSIGALGGTAIPTGQVDMDGFVEWVPGSNYSDFVATSITPVPESPAMCLGGLGAFLGSLFCYRFRRKA